MGALTKRACAKLGPPLFFMSLSTFSFQVAGSLNEWVLSYGRQINKKWRSVSFNNERTCLCAYMQTHVRSLHAPLSSLTSFLPLSNAGTLAQAKEHADEPRRAQNPFITSHYGEDAEVAC